MFAMIDRFKLSAKGRILYIDTGNAGVAMMAFKWLALVSALALSGCCVSSNGCYTTTPGTPMAWDGLGTAPTGPGEEPARPPRPKSRRSHEIVVGPLNGTAGSAEANSVPRDRWEMEQTANQAEEDRLAKKLMICRDCSPPARDDDTGKVAR
jgi:hypothetical protein